MPEIKSLEGLPGEKPSYPRGGDGTPDGYTFLKLPYERPGIGADPFYDGADERGIGIKSK